MYLSCQVSSSSLNAISSPLGNLLASFKKFVSIVTIWLSRSTNLCLRFSISTCKCTSFSLTHFLHSQPHSLKQTQTIKFLLVFLLSLPCIYYLPLQSTTLACSAHWGTFTNKWSSVLLLLSFPVFQSAQFCDKETMNQLCVECNCLSIVMLWK